MNRELPTKPKKQKERKKGEGGKKKKIKINGDRDNTQFIVGNSVPSRC